LTVATHHALHGVSILLAAVACLCAYQLPFANCLGLLAMQGDGSHQVYDGALKAPPLRAFLDGFAAKEGAGEDGAAAGGKQGSKDEEPGIPGLVPQVNSLVVANLTTINAEEGMWLIGFYSSAGAATGMACCRTVACACLEYQR
jgi:hypothetical protein